MGAGGMSAARGRERAVNARRRPVVRCGAVMLDDEPCGALPSAGRPDESPVLCERPEDLAEMQRGNTSKTAGGDEATDVMVVRGPEALVGGISLAEIKGLESLFKSLLDHVSGEELTD